MIKNALHVIKLVVYVLDQLFLNVLNVKMDIIYQEQTANQVVHKDIQKTRKLIHVQSVMKIVENAQVFQKMNAQLVMMVNI